MTVNTEDRSNIKRSVEIPRFVYAPVEIGQMLGTVRYQLGTQTIASTELVASTQVSPLVAEKNIFQIFLDRMKIYLQYK